MSATLMSNTEITIQQQSVSDTTMIVPISSEATTVVPSDAYATTQAEPTGTTPSVGGGSVVGWVGLAASVCVGFIAWKMITAMRKEIDSLKKSINELNAERNNLRKEFEILSSSFKSQKLDFETMRKGFSAVTHRSTAPQPSDQRQERSKKEPVKSQPSIQILYATLQSPDANGVLRFSERSMTETPSPQKLFQIEIDTAAGTGIYKLNPNAMSAIKHDLQLVKDFVKPFTFSGDIASATIKDKRVGRLSRQGNFWVVDEPLEISIS